MVLQSPALSHSLTCGRPFEEDVAVFTNYINGRMPVDTRLDQQRNNGRVGTTSWRVPSHDTKECVLLGVGGSGGLDEWRKKCH